MSTVAEKIALMAQQNKKTIGEVTSAIEEDAAGITQSAATIQEMANNVRTIAQEIRITENMTSDAKEEAVKGGESVIVANDSE